MLRRNVWMAAMALIVTTGLMTSVSTAQSSGAAPQNSNDDAPLLSGPTVSEDAATPKGPAMMGPNASQRKGEPRVPQRMWMREFEKLEISVEQQTQVDAVMKEFEAEQQAFREVYGKHAQELSKAMREARQNGGEVSLDMRKEFQQLRENAPKFETYQERIWNVLSTGQREQLTTNLNTVMKQIEERGDRRGNRAEGDDEMRPQRGRRPGPDGAEGAEDGPPRERGFDDRGARRRHFLMRHRMHRDGEAPAGEDNDMNAPRRPRGERGQRGPGGPEDGRPGRPPRPGAGELPPPPPPGQ